MSLVCREKLRTSSCQATLEATLNFRAPLSVPGILRLILPFDQLHPCKCAMSRIHITLTTPTQPEFNWLDSFESLEGEEIEGVILILRGALAAFSAELSDRREPSTDRALEDYKKKLQKIAKQINKQGLTETHKGDLDSLKISLAQAGSAQVEREESQPSKAGRQDLWLISNVIGWPYALLIFCALGKHKVERINEVQRVKLLKYVAGHRKLLFCRILEARAVQFRCQEKGMNLSSILSCILKYCRYQSRPFTYLRLQEAQETRNQG